LSDILTAKMSLVTSRRDRNIDTIGFSSSHFGFRRCLDKKFDT
jgi:hypothetical protein